MLEYEIIEATSKEDLMKKFQEFVANKPKSNMYGVQTHIVPTLTGIKFFITFMHARQSNLMVGQPGGQA